MTVFISFVSGKGGVGKTSSVINIGAALNFFGKDIIIVDGNLSMANIGIYLGSPVVDMNLIHVLKERYHITEVIYSHPCGLRVVPGNLSLEELKNLDSYNLRKSLEGLNGLSDFVLIDSSIGLNKEVSEVIEASDEVLIVTNPDLTSVTGAIKMGKLCEDLGKGVRGVVLTRTRDELDLSIENIEDLVGYPVIGVIPEDDAIRRSIFEQTSVLDSYPSSVAAICYKQLAASLLGRTYSEGEESRNFFHKLFK